MLRARKHRTLDALLAAAIAVGGFALPGRASADVIAPLSAARVAGAYGSDWHDRQLLRNPTNETLSGKIYLTLRGEGYNPDTDSAYDYSLPANTTITLEDLFAQLQPGTPGAGTLRLVPDEGQETPIWRATMFNRVDDSEFGAQALAFDPDIDGYHGVGKTLGTVLSSQNYRDNPFVQTGPDGVTGTWRYSNSAGGNVVEKPESIPPNTTKQYTGGVTQLLGFAPEPGAQLDLIIEEGNARAYISSNNNTSSDPAYDELEARTTINPAEAAILYVNTWLPRSDSGFYLSNREIRAMIGGGSGTRSYAHDLATELWNDPNVQTNFANVQEVDQWLRDRADGNPDNSEFCATFDPFLWDNDAQGEPGIAVYDGVGCGPVAFRPGAEAMQRIYHLTKGLDASGNPNDGFLTSFVYANPDEYGGQLHGVPDMSHNPTWNTQDQN